MPMIDSHIHLDQYSNAQVKHIIQTAEIDALICVSNHLNSLKRLVSLQETSSKIYCCAGFHPEQPLPTQTEKALLLQWMTENHSRLTAIGEVGLPHYLKRENPALDYQPYLELLERFIQIAKRYDLPLNLHIVYQDTDLALDLLEKYQIRKAHFHWFKSDLAQLERLANTPYFISLTPDILWNVKTQKTAEIIPLCRLMIETDGAWQHEGFEVWDIAGQLKAVLVKLAEIKALPVKRVAQQVWENTVEFYRLFG